jgi:hypothetical protein
VGKKSAVEIWVVTFWRWDYKLTNKTETEISAKNSKILADNIKRTYRFSVELQFTKQIILFAWLYE